MEDDSIMENGKRASRWSHGTHLNAINGRLLKLASYSSRMVFIDLILGIVIYSMAKHYDGTSSVYQTLALTVMFALFIAMNLMFLNRIRNIPSSGRGAVAVSRTEIRRMLNDVSVTELSWRPRIIYTGDRGVPTRISLSGIDDGRSLIHSIQFIEGLADGEYIMYGKVKNDDGDAMDDVDYEPDTVLRPVFIEVSGGACRLVVDHEMPIVPANIYPYDEPYGDSKTYYDEGVVYLNISKPKRDLVAIRVMRGLVPQLSTMRRNDASEDSSKIFHP